MNISEQNLELYGTYGLLAIHIVLYSYDSMKSISIGECIQCL